MNRQDMVEAGAEAIAERLAGTSWAGTPHRASARAVLDAVLPQITTEEQLQAVPEGALLMADHENGFQPEFIRWSKDRPYVLDDQSWWWDTDEEFLAAFSLIQVVWQPC